MNKTIKRKNLSMNPSKMYLILTFVFALLLVFFLTSKFFITDQEDILQTALNEKIGFSNSRSVTVNDWIYDKEKNEMQVTLLTENLSNYTTDVDFFSLSVLNTKEKLITDVVYESNDIFIINIQNVPKNFNQLSLKITEQTQYNDEKEERVIVSLYTDERVVKEKTITEKSINEYAARAVDEMIRESNVVTASVEKAIEEKKKTITDIESDTEKLKNDLLYQSLDEQTETNNRIFSLEKQAESVQKEINELKLKKKSQQAKIVKLEQKKEELML